MQNCTHCSSCTGKPWKRKKKQNALMHCTQKPSSVVGQSSSWISPCALTLLHALLQQTHRRYLTSNPLPSNYEHSCKIARGGPKTERLIGNEVWRTRDASPPLHYPAGSARGRSRKQVANRRLPSGSSSLGLPEL